MWMTSLCYIEKDNQYLMLHKDVDIKNQNYGKWVGIGGKFKEKESPEDCVIRETKEETGLTLIKPKFRGIITFVSDKWPTEYMYLFTANEFKGILGKCDEGTLEWVDKSRIECLPIWEGDKLFFRLLDQNRDFFSLKLIYSGNQLVDAFLDGEKIQSI